MLKIESFRKGLVLSSAFNVGAKTLGFLQSVAIAYYFGSQKSTDVFFYSLSAVTVISGLVSMLNASAIIPEAMKRRVQEGKESSEDFVNFFLIAYLILGAIFVCVAIVQPVRAMLLLSRFDEGALAQQSRIIVVLIPLVLFMTLAQYLIDVLVSYKYFTLPMIASAGTNVLALCAIVFTHSIFGIFGVAFAVLASYIIQTAALMFVMKKQLNWRFHFRFVRFTSDVKANMFFGQLGNVFSFFGGYAPYYVLSGLSTGVITAMNFGQRVSDLPAALITNQFSSLSGIKLNDLVARKDAVQLKIMFHRSVKFLVFILAPVGACLSIYSEEIIKVLYFRGAFSLETVEVASSFLRFLALSIPFFGIVTIGARLFMAAQLNRSTFWYQIVSNVLLVVFLVIFVRHLGYIGYPLALFLVMVLNVVVNGLYIRKFFPYLEYYTLTLYALGIVVLNWSIAWSGRLLASNFVQKDIEALALGVVIQVIVVLGLNLAVPLNLEVRAMCRTLLSGITFGRIHV